MTVSVLCSVQYPGLVCICRLPEIDSFTEHKMFRGVRCLKLSTVSQSIALCGNMFQSLIVLGKKEFLFTSESALSIFNCLLCLCLDLLLLYEMC